MRISQERSNSLYDSVREPIMDLRIALAKSNDKDLDLELFKLELAIWKGIKNALGLDKC